MFQFEFFPLIGKGCKRKFCLDLVNDIVLHSAKLLIGPDCIEPENADNNAYCRQQETLIIPGKSNNSKQAGIDGDKQSVRVIPFLGVAVCLFNTGLPLFQDSSIVAITIYFFLDRFYIFRL